MDGAVVDRFFKTRESCWRVLIESELSGRGLIIGDFEEKVGILLGEVLDEVFCVDTSISRLKAQTSVAKTMQSTVYPVHSDLKNLPFQSASFDVIVVRCPASRVGEYLSSITELLTQEGSVILIADGWPRESGITELVGMGDAPIQTGNRIRSTLRGHAFGISRSIEKANLQVIQEYALLSISKHENARGFRIGNEDALDWILYDSNKAASTNLLKIVRQVTRIMRNSGILHQCYPRYLFVCKNDRDEYNGEMNDGMLIAGKNRTTLLELSDGSIDSIRKVPNSRRQEVVNENAAKIIDAIEGSASETVPKGKTYKSLFGIERHEEKVDGTPLDQTLEPTPESVEKHLAMVFDWLIDLQNANRSGWVEKDPNQICADLTIESVGLSDPPTVEQTIELPKVVAHGDLFGSNIYCNDGQVANIIDWEWAKEGANPVLDPGFFLLQTADLLHTEFEKGIHTLFLDDRYRGIVDGQIQKYCECVGIDPWVFQTYLTISYINRIRRDLELNKRLDIDWVSRTQCVWKYTKETDFLV
ncbi:hypothetical protein ACLI4Q_18665 [Natrialbaceae archaeon A-CW1-1]